MSRRSLKPGDPVVYRKPKHSSSPGPRARSVHATPRGEEYLYEVDKFWVVEELRDDGTVLLRTRRGKRHVVALHDPKLRRARWWERLLYRKRFPALGDTPAP